MARARAGAAAFVLFAGAAMLAVLLLPPGARAQGLGPECDGLGRKACRKTEGCIRVKKRGCQRTASNNANCGAIDKKKWCRRVGCRWVFVPPPPPPPSDYDYYGDYDYSYDYDYSTSVSEESKSSSTRRRRRPKKPKKPKKPKRKTFMQCQR